jgi:hypothetical protein
VNPSLLTVLFFFFFFFISEKGYPGGYRQGVLPPPSMGGNTIEAIATIVDNWYTTGAKAQAEHVYTFLCIYISHKKRIYQCLTSPTFYDTLLC